MDHDPIPTTAASKVSVWLAVLSGIVTTLLTVYNSYTSSEIQKREDRLKQSEIFIKNRTTDIEASKERVDRYKWVLSLYPDIAAADTRKRNFTIGLIRLALDTSEAQQLFTGFLASNDPVLINFGQNGKSAISLEPIAALVTQLDGGTSAIRLKAFGQLKAGYSSSSQAIDLVLGLYDSDKLKNLSANGIINGLYFLGGTDAQAWSEKQHSKGLAILSNLQLLKNGEKVNKAINFFKQKIGSL